MNLLTLFNHTGSRPCFPVGYASWAKAHSLPTDVKIIEDGESTRAVGGVEYVRVNAGCSGYARWEALKYFVAHKEYTHLMVLDNDLLFSKHFDLLTYSIWVQFHKRHPICVASPYRPALSGHTRHESPMGEYVWKSVTSDSALFMDQEAATACLNAIDWSKYRQGWGWALQDHINGCIVPNRTLVLHDDPQKDGQNSKYNPDGFNWPGEDWKHL